MVSELNCRNCEHGCHCGNSGQCPIEDCDCINCEHNALDDFWKHTKEDGTHIQK